MDASLTPRQGLSGHRLSRLCLCPACAANPDAGADSLLSGGLPHAPQAQTGPTASYSAEQAATQILRDLTPGMAWSPGQSLTYKILTTNPGTSLGGEHQSLIPAGAAFAEAARRAFAAWDEVVDLDFTEVSGSAPAQLTLGIANIRSYAYGYYPAGPNNRAEAWFSTTDFPSTDAARFLPGQYPLQTLIHEIGHMLGLAHPGDYNAAPGTSIRYDRDALYREDTRAYTVMSYFDARADGVQDHGGQYSATPMLHDVTAVRRIYGAEQTAIRPGDTRYGFGASSDVPVHFDFARTPRAIVAIQDGGGQDHLDLSGSTAGVTVSLEPGTLGSALGLKGNLTILPGTVIERLTGSAKDDTLTAAATGSRLEGGEGRDILQGSDGDDLLLGGAGDDTLRGGAGADDAAIYAARRQDLQVTLADGVLYIRDLNPADGDEGADVATGVELLTTADGTIAMDGVANEVPQILFLDGRSPAQVQRREGEIALATITASDPEGDLIRFSLAGSEDQGLFRINAETGLLSFADPADFEAPADRNGDNLYAVSILATDRAGGSARQDLEIQILDRPEAPVFSDPTPLALSVPESARAITQVSARDPEGATFRYGLEGPAARNLRIDAEGRLTWVRLPDFEAGPNTRSVTITASDGSLIGRRSVTLTVTDADEPPVLTPPRLGIFTLREGTLAAGTLQGRDPEGKALTWRLTGPDASLFTLDAGSGALRFRDRPDFEVPEDGLTTPAQALGYRDNRYQVIAHAGDGRFSSAMPLTIRVTNRSDEPPAPRILNAATLSLDEATGAESGPLLATILRTSSGARLRLLPGLDGEQFRLDPVEGKPGSTRLSFVTPPDFERPADADRDGRYRLEVLATGPEGAASLKLLQITVRDRLVLGGTREADVLEGDASAERLLGFAGEDLLKGGPGNDRLEGGSGADRLQGGPGDDHYRADAQDQILEASEGGGQDRVEVLSGSLTLPAGVEDLILLGSAAAGIGNGGANRLTGSGRPNRLEGGGGADELDGKAGADVLLGGPGPDRFLFTTSPGMADSLPDFSAEDRILLLASRFKALGKPGPVHPTLFQPDGTPDGTDRLIHDVPSGLLSYDADAGGRGAPKPIARLPEGYALTLEQILLV